MKSDAKRKIADTVLPMAPRKQKPPISEWIVRERKRMGWKPSDVSEKLKAAGYEAEESTVQVWEAGRVPRAETIDALEKMFGSTAPRDDSAQNGNLGAVIAAQTIAIERQTAVLERVLALLEGRGGLYLSQLVAGIAGVEPGRSETDLAGEADPLDAADERAAPARRRR